MRDINFGSFGGAFIIEEADIDIIDFDDDYLDGSSSENRKKKHRDRRKNYRLSQVHLKGFEPRSYSVKPIVRNGEKVAYVKVSDSWTYLPSYKKNLRRQKRQALKREIPALYEDAILEIEDMEMDDLEDAIKAEDAHDVSMRNSRLERENRLMNKFIQSFGLSTIFDEWKSSPSVVEAFIENLGFYNAFHKWKSTQS